MEVMEMLVVSLEISDLGAESQYVLSIKISLKVTRKEISIKKRQMSSDCVADSLGVK